MDELVSKNTTNFLTYFENNYAGKKLDSCLTNIIFKFTYFEKRKKLLHPYKIRNINRTFARLLENLVCNLPQLFLRVRKFIEAAFRVAVYILLRHNILNRYTENSVNLHVTHTHCLYLYRSFSILFFNKLASKQTARICIVAAFCKFLNFKWESILYSKITTFAKMFEVAC